MNKQPQVRSTEEALRLADLLITPYTECNREAAAELRRLHEVNQELLDALNAWQTVCDRIIEQYGGAVAGINFFQMGEATRTALAKAGKQP